MRKYIWAISVLAAIVFMQPCLAGSANATVSADGTLTPPAKTITDAKNNTWSLSGGFVYKDGKELTATNVILLLYYKGAVYQENSQGNWAVWVNNAWLAGSDPRVLANGQCGTTVETCKAGYPFNFVSVSGVQTWICGATDGGANTLCPAKAPVSPSGTTVPSATQIIDTQNTSWGLSAGLITENGKPTYITNSILLLYYKGALYEENAQDNWFAWTDGKWVEGTDPRVPASGQCGASLAACAVGYPLNITNALGTASWSCLGTNGGPNASCSTVPPQAAGVGYFTQTFNSTAMNTGWYFGNFYSATDPSQAVQNADGSLYIPGTNNTSLNGQLMSAHRLTGATWQGTAFGGGGYFEATLSFLNGNSTISTSTGWPSFWMMSLEHLNKDYNDQWQGQVSGYTNFAEIDALEYDVANALGSNVYSSSWHDWYGVDDASCVGNYCDTTLPYAQLKARTPIGTDFSQQHKYGLLWVPATATTQGYIQPYFDGFPIGAKTVWNQFNPAAPPAPVMGTTALSVMDTQHLVLLLGTGTNFPMTVTAVQVWQASSAHNLAQ